MRRGSRVRSPLRDAVRALLLLALGTLLGANAMYYAMTHELGRRWGLHAGVDASRIEAPLPLPPTASVDAGLAIRTPTSAPETASPTAPATPTSMPSGAASLLIPVQGIVASQLQDTFADARGEGRVHDAIDIMAPAGTPVLAVADGHVEKLFQSKQGGLTVYQFDPSGTYAYYYAHLQGYAPGLAENKAVKRGETIGYVGATGNADPAAPHLHFAVYALGPEQRWWKGEAINPYPLLVGRPAPGTAR